MYIYMHADSQIHVSDMTHLTQAHTGCINSDLFQDTKESTCVTLTNSWMHRFTYIQIGCINT